MSYWAAGKEQRRRGLLPFSSTQLSFAVQSTIAFQQSIAKSVRKPDRQGGRWC
jgi:hypothetical protein